MGAGGAGGGGGVPTELSGNGQEVGGGAVVHRLEAEAVPSGACARACPQEAFKGSGTTTVSTVQQCQDSRFGGPVIYRRGVGEVRGSACSAS